jgi:hypothetical protein
MNEDQTRLDRLIAELRGLPDLDNRQSIVGRLRAIKMRIDVATRQVNQAKLGRSGLKSIAGSGTGSNDNSTFKKLEEATQDLLDFVRNGRVTPGSKRDETLTTNIADAADRLFKSANVDWTDYFAERNDGFCKLASAATEANLNGARDLENAVEALTRLTQTIPLSPEGVSTAGEALAKVREAIKDLGLEGRAGQFLVAAVQEVATLEMVQAEEVQRFLLAHSAIAKMLRVRL